MIGPRFEAVLGDARAGVESAFAAIYEDLAPVVRGLARGKGLRDADDVVTETMLSVAKGLGRFHGEELDFRSWVFTIAYRRIADEYRRQSRRVPAVKWEDGFGDAASESAEHVALQDSLSPELMGALGRLSADQRDVLLLRVLGDLPIAEVAKVVGKKEGAVKMLQSRAIRAMTDFLTSDVASTPLPDDRSV